MRALNGLVSLLLAAFALGQTPPAPCEAAVPCSAGLTVSTSAVASPAGADVLALLDDTPIRLADLDEGARKSFASLDASVADAHEEALRTLIEDVLLDVEAAQRHVGVSQLLLAEVRAKVNPPTRAEIAQEIAANPSKYKDGAEDADWAAGSLYERRLAERQKEYLASLEAKHRVKLDPTVAHGAAGTIGKRKITATEVRARLHEAEARTRASVLSSLKESIDGWIDAKLLAAEAARRGITADELTRVEITAKAAAATPNASQLETWLKTAELARAFASELRKGHVIRTMIDVPPAPAITIDVSRAPASGSSSAAVTLVEWGDFQCPPCGLMSHIIDKVLGPYGDRVRYVFLQFPLSIHPNAWKAAEAGLAAHAQGKFFEFAHILFAHQDALDVPSLKRYATEAGLDRERFDRDLDSGRFAADVLDDQRHGMRAGVGGTPALFLNGVELPMDAYSVEGMRAAIDAAMGTESGDVHAVQSHRMR